MDNAVLDVKVQFDFATIDKIVKQRRFLEAALNAVYLVGDDGDGRPLLLGKSDHIHEMLAIAIGRRFDDSEGSQYLQAFAPAIFLHTIDLRINRITFFLFARG